MCHPISIRTIWYEWYLLALEISQNGLVLKGNTNTKLIESIKIQAHIHKTHSFLVELGNVNTVD